MVKVVGVSIFQKDFEQIYHFYLKNMNVHRSREGANNLLDEFINDVSIHLLLVVQF